MSIYKKTSRSTLFDDQIEDQNDDQYIAPNIEFEFVQVDHEDAIDEPIKESNGGISEPAEEFDFPLFGSNPVVQNNPDEVEFPLFSVSSTQTTKSEERGRLETRVMKVSLREESVESIKQARPQSYYFAQYTTTERDQFLASAVTIEQVSHDVDNFPAIVVDPWKCVDLDAYNKRIDRDRKIEKKRARTRPGTKARQTVIESRVRKLEREKIYKRQENERLAKLRKKMFRKRGGKKHKKAASKGSNATATNKSKHG
jgi:hypothetical protein